MSNISMLRNILNSVVKSDKDKEIVKYYLNEANKNHNVMYDIHKNFDPDFSDYRNFDDFHKENEYYRKLGEADSVDPIQEFYYSNAMASTLDDPNDFPFGMSDYDLERNSYNYNKVKDFLPKDYIKNYDRNSLVKAILEKFLQEE